MRVLLVTGSFPPMRCGVGEYTRGLARALARAGQEVAVLTSAAAAEGARGEPYQVLAEVPRWSLRHARTALAAVRRFAPDVVHQQFPTQGYDGALAWLLPLLLSPGRAPVVQTWHEYLPGRSRPGVWELAVAAAPGPVVVVRPGFLERMPRVFRALVARRPFRLIPNAPTLPRVELDEEGRAAVRARWAPPGRRLLVFFGFPYEHKGVDDLLAIMDPARDHVVLAGAVLPSDPFQVALERRLRDPPLAARTTLTGFLPEEDAAALLAAADAVVLPLRKGGGPWNTSLKAAALSGTFVLTTATDRHGYDAAENVYFARPADLEDLRGALAAHAGRRRTGPSPGLAGPGWPEIAEAHLEVYRGA